MEDRQIELIIDIKKVKRLKQKARLVEERKAYDRLEYILTKWKEAVDET